MPNERSDRNIVQRKRACMGRGSNVCDVGYVGFMLSPKYVTIMYKGSACGAETSERGNRYGKKHNAMMVVCGYENKRYVALHSSLALQALVCDHTTESPLL